MSVSLRRIYNKKDQKKVKYAFNSKNLDCNTRISLNDQNKNRLFQQNSSTLQQQKQPVLQRNNQKYMLPQRLQFSQPQDFNSRLISYFIKLQSNAYTSINSNQFQGLKNKKCQRRSTVTFSYSKQITPQSLSSIIKIQANQGRVENIPMNNSMVKFSHTAFQAIKQKKPKAQISISREYMGNSVTESKQDSTPLDEWKNTNKKFILEMRQAVSITQPQEQNVRESVVISRTHFYRINNSITNLKPISESEIEAGSFIANPKNH